MLTCRWRRRAVVCTSSSVICVRSTTCIASVWRHSLASSNELCTSNRYIQLMVIHPVSTIIQTGRKFLHTFIQILMNWLLPNFCAWHDSTAVVPYSKICSDIIGMNGIIVKQVFHRLWVMIERCWWSGTQLLTSYGPVCDGFVYSGKW